MGTEEKEVNDLDVKKLDKLLTTIKGNLAKNGITGEETMALGALLLVGGMVEEECAIPDIYTEGVEAIGNALVMLMPGDEEGEDADAPAPA